MKSFRQSLKSIPFEEKKRLFELVVIFLCSFTLLFLSRLETRLFSLSESLSENKEFFTTIAYFALININVILILFLGFLIFRNVTKLIIERKKGVIGSKLRTKLVFALVFFAMAPTILLLYVSMQFITKSFDTWFSEKVGITMQQTREAGSLIYRQDQKRVQGLARIALQRIVLQAPSEFYQSSNEIIQADQLAGFSNEYGISAIKVYLHDGTLAWSSSKEPFESPDHFAESAIISFLKDASLKDLSTVVAEDRQDVVKGVAPVYSPRSGRLLGLVVAEVRFESQILKSIEKIIADFANLRPGAQLIQLSYVILMLVITLLIVFCAIWMGFYVAKEVTDPFSSLAEATREIALGNYNIALTAKTDDETGQLVQSFNLMAADLRKHQQDTQEAQNRLQRSNLELDQRRQYMEIVLKHIDAGVVSLDNKRCVTSLNAAAEKILGVKGAGMIGSSIEEVFSDGLVESFWGPILAALANNEKYSGSILYEQNRGFNVVVNASRVYDENEVEVGCVVVFDDALKQMRSQKVAAWKEVARRIAHEIKNPITPIKLNAQRLLRKFNDKFEGQDYQIFRSCLESIITQVDSLRDLVNEFSKFSRLPAIRPEAGDVTGIIAEAVRLFQMSYSDVVFDTKGLSPLPELQIDKKQLHRAIVNLLTNAIASLEDSRPGWIAISCSLVVDLNLVQIVVKDNGCGIPEELRERVLEPYFSTKDEGTGLGLAIVNQIVSDHGGYFRLKAVQPYGTAAIIEIPLHFSGVDPQKEMT